MLDHSSFYSHKNQQMWMWKYVCNAYEPFLDRENTKWECDLAQKRTEGKLCAFIIIGLSYKPVS